MLNFTLRELAQILLIQDPFTAIVGRVAGLERQLEALRRDMMATQAEFNARMNAMDDATNEIAKDLKTLRDALAAGTIPDSAIATLDAKIGVLEALGKDPV